MNGTNKTPATPLGLQDFLFYLVPGSIVLLSILLVAGANLETMQHIGGFGASIFAVLLAYFVGQVFYAMTYPLRRKLGWKHEWLDEPAEFKISHLYLLKLHDDVYIREVSRYRSLARFSAAMVVPSLLLAVGVAVRATAGVLAFVGVLSLGAYAAWSFSSRHRHYNNVFHQLVAYAAETLQKDARFAKPPNPPLQPTGSARG